MSDGQRLMTSGDRCRWSRLRLRALRICFALVVTLVGVVLSFWWMDRYVTVLAWPAIALAQLGIKYSWLIIPSLFAGWLYWVGRQTLRQGWLRSSCMTVLFVAGYCVLARWFLTGTPTPTPSNSRFSENGEQILAYQESYDIGYRDGMVGIMSTYCFRPEAETLGSYEGAKHGYLVWCRVWGRTIADRESRHFRSSAGIDGVDLPLE